jgi:Txe/YoeB family toxin of Txe-Axe toxin-antitoxin module
LARIIRLTPGYLRTFRRLKLDRSRAAIAGVVSSLGRDSLPGPADFETNMPKTLRVWARRVPGGNLWLYYLFDANEVRVLTVMTVPPVPIDE